LALKTLIRPTAKLKPSS